MSDSGPKEALPVISVNIVEKDINSDNGTRPISCLEILAKIWKTYVIFFRMSVVKPWDVFRIVDQEDNHTSNGKALRLCKKFVKVGKETLVSLKNLL